MNNFYFHFYCDQTELKREREFLYNAFVTLVGPLNVSCGTDVNLIPNTTTCFVIWMDPPRTSPPFFVRKYQFNTVYIAIDSYKSVMYRLLLGFGFNLSYHMHPLPNVLSILPQALRPFIISHGLSHQVCSNLLNTPPSLLTEREYDLGFVGSLLGLTINIDLIYTFYKKQVFYSCSFILCSSFVLSIFQWYHWSLIAQS